MSEETWHAARLIPTSGINGATEQERRATSALLAVLGVVPDFAKALLSGLGAPAGNVTTFIEVPFLLGESRIYPDGLIRVRRGAREWTALVEVKTGKNQLETQQLENYLDIARAEGFDSLITISNEIPPTPGQHPTPVDRRKLRKVALVHWSWSEVLATAIVQKEHRGVSDPEQAWILGELATDSRTATQCCPMSSSSRALMSSRTCRARTSRIPSCGEPSSSSRSPSQASSLDPSRFRAR